MKTIAKLGAVAIVLLIVFVMVFVFPQKIREDFVSSSQLLMQAQTQQGLLSSTNLATFDAALKRADDLASLDDSGRLLLLKRCYQFSQEDVIQNAAFMMPANTYNVQFHDMFTSMQQIEDRIVQEIGKFSTAITTVVKGNIYVMITQVPYFKNERGNPVYASYYVDNALNFQPSTARNDIYYSITIIFANYDANKTYNKTSSYETNTMPSMESKASNDKQCFIQCVHSGNACGCATASSGAYTDDASYSTTCFGRNSSTDTSQLTPATFTILYTVNKNYQLIHSLVG